MLMIFLWVYVQQQQTPERIVALREQQAIERMQTWHQVVTMIYWAGGVAVALALLSVAFWLAVKVKNARERIYAKDGLFPIVIQNTGTLLDDWRGRSQRTIHNPNMLALPAGTVRVERDGTTALHSGLDGFSHQQLLTAHSGQQRVQRTQAGGRERAPSKWQVLADNNLLERALPPRRAEPLQIEAEPDAPRLTATDALRQSTRDEIVLGQADDGRLCKVNLRTAVHLAIVGATGTGKSVSTGYQLALAALGRGYQVVVLDPKGGMDWRAFERVCEWHDTDVHNIGDQMWAVHCEYLRRMQIAKQYDVNHIAKLNSQELPPLLIVLEEYGDLCARMNTGTRNQIDGWIDGISQRGRAADVHLALIDQFPQNWSKQLMMATKAKVIYKMGPGQGNVVGDWHAQNLPDHGRFRHDLHEYNAWFVEPHLPHYLDMVQSKLPRYPALIDGQAVRVDQESGVRPSGEGVYTGTGHTPPPDTGQWTDTGQYNETQERVWDYLRENPSASVRAVADALNISKTQVGVYRKQFFDGEG